MALSEAFQGPGNRSDIATVAHDLVHDMCYTYITTSSRDAIPSFHTASLVKLNPTHRHHHNSSVFPREITSHASSSNLAKNSFARCIMPCASPAVILPFTFPSLLLSRAITPSPPPTTFSRLCAPFPRLQEWPWDAGVKRLDPRAPSRVLCIA